MYAHGDESDHFAANAQSSVVLLGLALALIAVLVVRRFYSKPVDGVVVEPLPVRRPLLGTLAFLVTFYLGAVLLEMARARWSGIQSDGASFPVWEFAMIAVALGVSSKVASSTYVLYRTAIGVLLAIFLNYALISALPAAPTVRMTLPLVVPVALVTSREVLLPLLRGAASVALVCFFLPSIEQYYLALLGALAIMSTLLIVESRLQNARAPMRRTEGTSAPAGAS